MIADRRLDHQIIRETIAFQKAGQLIKVKIVRCSLRPGADTPTHQPQDPVSLIWLVVKSDTADAGVAAGRFAEPASISVKIRPDLQVVARANSHDGRRRQSGVIHPAV